MGFGVWGLGFGVWGLGFGVWGLGFGVWGLGFGVWGLGFRVGASRQRGAAKIDPAHFAVVAVADVEVAPEGLGLGFRVYRV